MERIRGGSLASGMVSSAQHVVQDHSQTLAMHPFVCPKCKGSLKCDGRALGCTVCERSYPLHDELPCFSRTDHDFGEFTRTEMDRLLAYMVASGWRTAIDRYVTPKRSFVRDLILDERRSNFTSLFELTGAEKVLDLGCGFGGISLQLSRVVEEVVSIDASYHRAAFLNIARRQEKIENIYPACHNEILNLPIEDNYFDVVALVGVFEYLPATLPEYPIDRAHELCLAEVCRVLKPGGALYLATKNRFGWHFLMGATDHNGIKFGPALPRRLADVLCRALHRRPYRIIVHSYGGYREILSKANFTDIEFFWPYPGYQIPDFIFSLKRNLREQVTDIGHGYVSDFKKNAFSSLDKIGLLRYIVPNYSIVARKVRSNAL